MHTYVRVYHINKVYVFGYKNVVGIVYNSDVLATSDYGRYQAE